MQQKWAAQRLISALQGQEGVRNRKKVAKRLLVFCFWNELIAETEQIRKTEGQASKELAPQWRRQMRRCRFFV